MCPSSEKGKVLDIEKKEKSYAEVAEIYERDVKNESSIHEIVRKEKELRAGFAVTPQSAKVTATVSAKCLDDMIMSLHLWV